MINKIYLIFLSLSLALILAGCNDDSVYKPEQPIQGAPGTLTISFNSAKGTRSANSDKSEDLIDNVTIALYTDGTEEDIAPVEVKTFSGLNGDGKKDVTMFLTNDMVDELFETPNKTNCRIFAVANVPSTAAIPEKPTIQDLKSIAVTSTFKTVPEQRSFVMAGLGAVSYSPSTETGTNSLGTASGNCTLARAAAKISLNVKLPPSITVNEGTPDEEIWLPVTETGNMIAYINNGVETAIAYPVNSLDEDPWKPTGEQADSYYYNSNPTQENTYRTFNPNGQVTENETVINPDGTETTAAVTYNRFGINVPFYTYPNAWSDNNYEDTSQTTLTLIVRWRKDGVQEWTNYYYQVPVTPTEIHQIDANHSYSINLKVGMLGSLVPETPLEVEGTYQVMNWSNTDVDVDINDYRYLVVNPNNISVQNEAEVTIPFYSSHEVDINNLSMTFQRFNFYSNGNGDVVDITVPQSKLDASETNGEKMVSYEIVTDPLTNQKAFKINHPLEIWEAVNSNGQEVTFTNKSGYGNQTLTAVTNSIDHFVKPTNPETPFSSYVFRIRIQHDDNPSYYEDITITQYPGMYIEAKQNPGGSYNTSDNRNNYTSNFGFVFVNPTLTQGSRRAYWTNSTTLGGVFGLTGENTNPNMYVITISQLDAGSKYIIGDPRSQYINNSLSGNVSLRPSKDEESEAGNWCNSATTLYDNIERRLKYYYPTNESPVTSDTAKMVAPKIRIASSWGVTNSITRQNARRRAATYQEQGCPAGRWRLPTLGEFTFITQLSAAGKIPTLFSLDNNYLTAQGVYQVNAQGVVSAQTDATSTAIRAVYDEWYWEQFPQYEGTPGTYTLGDMPKVLN